MSDPFSRHLMRIALGITMQGWLIFASALLSCGLLLHHHWLLYVAPWLGVSLIASFVMSKIYRWEASEIISVAGLTPLCIGLIVNGFTFNIGVFAVVDVCSIAGAFFALYCAGGFPTGSIPHYGNSRKAEHERPLAGHPSMA